MALKGKMQSIAVLAAYVTGVIWLVNLVLSKVGINLPAQIFGIGDIANNVPLATGLTGTIGAKVLGFINGLVTFNVGSLVELWISAFAIILVGTFLIDKVRMLPQGKGESSRLALILLYGTAVFYLVLVGFKMLSWTNLVGIAIWYAIVAFSVGAVKKYIRI